MIRFKITYLDDNGDKCVAIRDFEDTDSVTAKEWAEDCANALADKGPYECESME